jgi:hypothetical protein
MAPKHVGADTGVRFPVPGSGACGLASLAGQVGASLPAHYPRRAWDTSESASFRRRAFFFM